MKIILYNRLWSKVTQGILQSNMDQASTEKHNIEENQRNLLKKRQENNKEWEPRFFKQEGNEWILKLPDTEKPLTEHILEEFIFKKKNEPEYVHFWISDLEDAETKA